MKISEQVKETILQAFKKDIDAHLFSDKNLPLSVEIKTNYEDCNQSIVIEFEKGNEK